MRKAALKELVLAVQLLVDGQQFTPGIATAVCGHIQHALHEMRLLNEMGLPSTDIYIEHAQLLPLGPLRELLHFLWVHIGLRFNALPAVEHWRQRLRQVRNASLQLVQLHLLPTIYCHPEVQAPCTQGNCASACCSSIMLHLSHSILLPLMFAVCCARHMQDLIAPHELFHKLQVCFSASNTKRQSCVHAV